MLVIIICSKIQLFCNEDSMEVYSVSGVRDTCEMSLRQTRGQT